MEKQKSSPDQNEKPYVGITFENEEKRALALKNPKFVELLVKMVEIADKIK